MNGTEAPRRTLITTRQEYRDAVDRLLAIARDELCIFDPDLSELGFTSPERIVLLRRFLERGPDHRVFIALHRTDHVVRHMPRLVALLAPFSRNLAIHQTHGDAARVQDCFFLCDNLHFVRRAVAQQPRGAVYLHDPLEASGMRERFRQIWESSEPGVSAVQTGLA